ncbi:MAG: hypothetical protein A2039_00575 [Candidatus Melainabacteria bacterium GWA2_34_9]|nr:MAG: hypothetical protein A2039_00575 [Candidatus Melainabacteria bacterium GWA2_34_9]
MANIKKKTISFTQQDVKARENSFALTGYERVTTFNFNEEDKEASIYTYNKDLIKKLDKYCQEFPKLYKLTNTDKYGKYIAKTYSVPKEMISVRFPTDLPEKQSNVLINIAKKRIEAEALKQHSSVQLSLLNIK